MKQIQREMKSTETSSDYERCQASFNSDGVLTLRRYCQYNKDKDEIIIFSRTETEAILQLFRAMKESRIELPF